MLLWKEGWVTVFVEQKIVLCWEKHQALRSIREVFPAEKGSLQTLSLKLLLQNLRLRPDHTCILVVLRNFDTWRVSTPHDRAMFFVCFFLKGVEAHLVELLKPQPLKNWGAKAPLMGVWFAASSCVHFLVLGPWAFNSHMQASVSSQHVTVRSGKLEHMQASWGNKEPSSRDPGTS